MPISFDHTTVAARDRQESATFLIELFGLPDADIHPQHYAFLFSEQDFDGFYRHP